MGELAELARNGSCFVAVGRKKHELEIITEAQLARRLREGFAANLPSRVSFPRIAHAFAFDLRLCNLTCNVKARSLRLLPTKYVAGSIHTYRTASNGNDEEVVILDVRNMIS
jgi:hypothetical protein